VLSSTQVVLNLPIAVQEMVLAVWLIVKRFQPEAQSEGDGAGAGAADGGRATSSLTPEATRR